ncbi:MAG: YfhO family protein [Proteobacteria bacterium]|nr:YfhO family protein [Pseudomonadota bacterium]MBU1687346.1 YfhO family protein [Pseudomonadota bacterium]
MLKALEDLGPTGSSYTHDSSTARRFSLGLLTVLVLIFFSRFLFTGRFFLLRDLIFDFFAREEFYKSHLLNGFFPLWNHFTGGGEPFLENMESAVFYPPNLLFLLFPVPTANVILVTLHVLMAAWGVWLACRTWRVSPAGAVLAATAFAFSTQTVTRIEFYSFLCSYCWYPLIVALYCRWLRRRSVRRFLLVALAMSMQFMGGYPDAVLLTGLTLGLFGVFFGGVYWRHGGGWRGGVKPVAGLVGMSALVLVLCAVQILPVLDILSYALRVEMGARLGQASFHPLMLLSALFPYLFGVPGYEGKFWAPTSLEFWMTTCYVGILPVALCLAGLWTRAVGGRPAAVKNQVDPVIRFRVPALCLVLVFFVLYAMGEHTPFYQVFEDLIPLVKLFRWPSKALMCVSFAVCCLAGISIDQLMAEGPGRMSGLRQWLAKRLPVAACLLAALFMFVCLMNRGSVGQWFLRRYFYLDRVNANLVERIPWAVLFDQAWIFIVIMVMTAFLFRTLFSKRSGIRGLTPWVMVVVVFLDLLLTTFPILPSSDMDIMRNKGPFKGTLQAMSTEVAFIRPFSQQFLYGVRNEELLRQERDTMAGSWAMVDRVHNARPMGDFPLQNYISLFSLYSSRQVDKSTQDRLGRILGIEFWLDTALSPGYFEDGDIIRPGFQKIGNTGPNALVVGGVEKITDPQDLLQVIVGEGWDRSKMALATEIPAGIDPSLIGNSGQVNHRIIRYEEGGNRLSIAVECEKPGILVTTGTYYPGWDARVNGVETPVFQTDGAFQSVAIPAGFSRVELEFRPRTLLPGLVISLLALSLTLAFVLINGRGRRS